MPDPQFADPRLAVLYDVLDHDRSDLEPYLDLAHEVQAHRVLDIGCGTGSLAVLLAARGHDVVAVDPAAASIDVARQKPGAHQVRWLIGDATDLPGLAVDLAVMTGNVAQVFVEDDAFAATLVGTRRALRPGGQLVLESRDPAHRAWLGWTRERSYRETALPGSGSVASWVEVLGVQGELVRFRWTYVFSRDGSVVTSDSTLRFRSLPALTAGLVAAGFRVDEVRGAPDRPDEELVVMARSYHWS